VSGYQLLKYQVKGFKYQVTERSQLGLDFIKAFLIPQVWYMPLSPLLSAGAYIVIIKRKMEGSLIIV
jgi:hypothetical protein